MGAVKRLLEDLAFEATTDPAEGDKLMDRIMRGDDLTQDEICMVLRGQKARELLNDGGLWEFMGPCVAAQTMFLDAVFNKDPSDLKAIFHAAADSPLGMAEAKRLVIRAAELQHAHLPQYTGHWRVEGWRLVRILKDKKPRGVVWFDKGELTIARHSAILVPCYEDAIDIYSFSMRGECVVENRLVRWQE